MIKRRTILFLFMLIPFSGMQAQGTKFEVVFGASLYEYPRSVIQTYDKGYIVTGSTSSSGAGNSDIHILKIDSAGNWKWEAVFGGNNIEWGYDVTETPDSGYAVAGYTNSYGAGGYDMYVIRMDKNGNILWSKTYGGSDWDFAYSIKNTRDGGFIIAGSTYSFGAGDEDVYLVKTDANGNVQWTKTYGGINEDHSNAVIQSNDGGYFITGYSNSYGAGNYDLYSIKTNAGGDTLWTRTAGGPDDDKGTCNLLTLDSNLLAGGFSKSFGTAGSYDYSLIKYNTFGNIIWTHTMLGGPGDDKGYALAELKSGTLGIIGYTLSFGLGLKDYFLNILSSGGAYIGGGTYGGTKDDIAYAVKATQDNGFIIAGETSSYGRGLTDIYLLKTDSAGKSSSVVIIGMEEKKNTIKKDRIQLFPNPADESMFFSLEKDPGSDIIKIVISDVLGRTVYEKENPSYKNGEAMKIETLPIQTGIYLISVYSEGLKIATEKICIRHP